MPNAVVYVTQLPRKKGAEPIDLTPAYEHGDVHILFPPNGGYADPRELQADVAEKLKDYHPSADCLVLMGDPIIQAACVADISRRFDDFVVLRYDRLLRRYMRATLN